MNNENRVQSVMVIDDTPANLGVLEALLSARGYEVLTFPRGEIALKAALNNVPDLILLDIMMPGMDGFEVCRRLKAEKTLCDVPVIFISALDDAENKVKAFANGGVDYVCKPFQSEEVLARVATHLSLSRMQKDLERQNEILNESIKLREAVDSITRHDLKSPLNLILSIPDLLLNDKSLSADQRELLKMQKKSGLRMLEMINRSLDLAKMERGMYKLNPVPVNILKIMQMLMGELSAPISDKKLNVKMIVDGTEISAASTFILRGEECLFFSLLSNLIKNAVEASPPGGEVCIALDSIRQHIEIRNQGQIPSAIRERLANEKYVTAGKTGGTGLGVYSASLMTKTLGGAMSFASSADSGTVFSIDFAGNHTVAEADGGVGRKQQEHAAAALSEKKLLIIAAYDGLRSLIAKVFFEQGIGKIFEAANLSAARNIVISEKISLIVSDINVADESGLEFLNEVRSVPGKSDIPFILYAGEASPEVLAEIKNDGRADLLLKPFSPDSLREKLHEFLKTAM